MFMCSTKNTLNNNVHLFDAFCRTITFKDSSFNKGQVSLNEEGC